MAKNNHITPPSANLLAQGTHINGDITSDGDLRVDGQVQGSIQARGKVIIGQSGRLEGVLNCQNADIEGIAKAEITVKELLTLKENSSVDGNLTIGKLAIEPGAQFTGSCKMNGQSGNTAKGHDKKQS